MISGDPNAIWVMRGWLFKNDLSFWTPKRYKALLTSALLGWMLMLDLQADVYLHLESFYGQPFIFRLWVPWAEIVDYAAKQWTVVVADY